LIFRSIDQNADSRKEEDNHKIVITFKDAIPFSLTALLMYAYTRSDAILLTRLIPDGAHEAGIYAAGFRLLDAANMIAILVTPLLIPMYARLYNDRKESGELLHLAAGIIIVMTCTISIAGFFWSRPIMILCYGHDEMQWLTTFRLLILCHIPIGLMYVYGSYLTAHRQLAKQNAWFAIMVIVNIGLNILLIPRLSTTGASIAAIITEFLATLGVIVLAYQHLKNMPDAGWLMRSILYVGILAVTAWMMSTWISIWWIAILIFCVLSLALAFLVRLLNWRKIRQLLGQMETA
jgi:O-antigen/teichoic acid export membrane protein